MRLSSLFCGTLLIATVLGCSENVTKRLACEPGDLRPCTCDAGGDGQRSCVDGSFGACDCQGAMDSSIVDARTPDRPMLGGRLFDAASGQPIAGARVQTDSGEKTQTDEGGRFALETASQARALSIAGEGIARSVELSPANATYLELFVKRLDVVLVFDADEGVTARTASGARIHIPPAAVRTKVGGKVSVPVTLELAEIDGTDREQASALPSDMEALRLDGKVGSSALPSALHVTIRQPNGEELDVDREAKVTAELPVREGNATLERSAFSFDEVQRRWVEEGKAQRTIDDRGERVYRVQIEHLSWWSYGDFIEQLACLAACVKTQDGDPVQSAQIWMVGATFAGVQSVFTGKNGCVESKAPADSELVLVAQAQKLVSRSRKFAVPAELGGNACNDAGTLVLDLKREDACPAGYVACAGVCVDPATDRAHCGGCGTSCAGEAGRGEVCLAGACACAARTPPCGTGATLVCADILEDPLACGACGAPCNETQECVGASCVTASCPQGSQRCGRDCVDVQGNDLNCGTCGRACAAGQQCSKGECLQLSVPVMDAGIDPPDTGIPDAGTPDTGTSGCPSGFAECDGVMNTVCEADLSSAATCGSCTKQCTTSQGTPGCSAGNCVIAGCSAGFDDCDDTVATGCETTLATNALHCGECGRNCTAAGATCGSGMCSGVTLYTGRPYGSDNSAARTWAFGNGAAYHLGYNSYAVERLPVDGSGVTSVWSPTSKTGGTESLWVSNSDVTWAERGTPSVVIRKAHAALPGDLPQVVFTPEYQPQFLRVEGNSFYWASGDYQSGDPGGYIYSRLVSAPASDPGTRIVTTNQGNHGAIVALMTTTDAIYWVTSGPASDPNPYYLRTTPLAGGTPTLVPGGAITGGFATAQVALRSRGNTLYFNVNVGTSFLNGVYRYTPGDSAPTQLVSHEDVMTMVIDASSIYFLQQNVTGVFKAPIAGGAATKISDTYGTEIVGQDATYLYLASSSCCNTSLLKVVK